MQMITAEPGVQSHDECMLIVEWYGVLIRGQDEMRRPITLLYERPDGH